MSACSSPPLSQPGLSGFPFWHGQGSEGVMGNFCADLAGSEYPDSWSNTILDVPVEVFINEINICISRL